MRLVSPSVFEEPVPFMSKPLYPLPCLLHRQREGRLKVQAGPLRWPVPVPALLSLAVSLGKINLTSLRLGFSCTK